MSTKYSISGKVSAISRNQGKTKKGDDWQAVEFVVTESNVEHPNTVKMKVYKQGDNLKYMPELNDGDVVDTEFNLNAREYNGKYYLEANCWSVKVTSEQPVGADADSQDLPF